jgi:hypothetical protein
VGSVPVIMAPLDTIRWPVSTLTQHWIRYLHNALFATFHTMHLHLLAIPIY